MDYEKKYKEALELMKDCVPDENGLVHVRPCDIFTELEESEDERIRKGIIENIKGIMYPNGGEEFRKKAIAWLEKQGEIIKNNMLLPFKEYDNLMESINKRKKEGYEAGYKQGLIDSKNEHHVQPKFKVGDVIRLKGSAAEYTIKKVTDTTYYTNGWSCGIERCEEDYELVEQKPVEWSEKDEDTLRCIIDALDSLDIRTNTNGEHEDHTEEINWLKDLKDRVQPKQEWSEDDKKVIDDIEWALIDKRTKEKCPTKYEEEINWLKSLRPQNWKPSDETMEALDVVIDFLGSSSNNALNDIIYYRMIYLRGELKKLKK